LTQQHRWPAAFLDYLIPRLSFSLVSLSILTQCFASLPSARHVFSAYTFANSTMSSKSSKIKWCCATCKSKNRHSSRCTGACCSSSSDGAPPRPAVSLTEDESAHILSLRAEIGARLTQDVSSRHAREVTLALQRRQRLAAGQPVPYLSAFAPGPVTPPVAAAAAAAAAMLAVRDRPGPGRPRVCVVEGRTPRLCPPDEKANWNVRQIRI
jgi:hypothetical protein